MSLIKCSANYCNANNNFVITGVDYKFSKKIKYIQTIKIVKNILNRGTPTNISKFLSGYYKYVLKNDELDYKLISKESNNWSYTIKGAENSIDNPALLFFDKFLPKYLEEYSFITNLILPECKINDIIQYPKEEYKDMAVDFYLPQADLIIEIDGKQHEYTKFEDNLRTEFLKKEVIRISVSDIRKETDKLKNIIKEIKSKLSKNKLIQEYKLAYEEKNEDSEEKKSLIMIIRLQMTLLELLKSGQLSFENTWKLNIKGMDNHTINLAITDLLKWFDLIFKLQKIDVKLPKFEIKPSEDSINIDIDIFKRYSDATFKNNTIFVRNDYFENTQKNYYRVECDDIFRYSLNHKNNEDLKLLSEVLENIFGFSKFRQGQTEIITNLLNLKDTVGILPTGSGKSLCYQISSLLQPGIAFIICPLKSLIKDQYDSMVKKHINNCQKIDSSLSSNERTTILFNLSKSKYQMLWVSPERFQSEDFRKVLNRININFSISYAVIDEVHCMSEWGHNFRTSYLQLINTIRKYTPQATIVGLTATASDHVLKDLKYEFTKDSDLSINEFEKEHICTTMKFDRPELEFEIINCKEKDKMQKLMEKFDYIQLKRDVLRRNGDKTIAGLIFSPFAGGERGCIEISNKLRNKYIKYKNNIGYYIGKKKYQTDSERIKIQDEYKNNEKTLLVATKSFGMGIDKENIRYVIHYGIPASLEALYQEVGRAGRGAIKSMHDNSEIEKSICYIIHAEPDYKENEENILFKQNATIKEIQEDLKENGFLNSKYNDKNSWSRGDVFDQLEMFISDKDDKESESIYKTYCTYIKDESKFEIKLNNEEELDVIEKHIYKLSLLGIITDWTVTYNPGYVLRGECAKLNNKQIEKNLNEYIKKYDASFDFKHIENNDIYMSLKEIISSNKPDVQKYIEIICTWYYENIIYNRRLALKNIDEFISSFNSTLSRKESTEKFNKKIQDYFNTENYNLILKYIDDNSIKESFNIFWNNKKIDFSKIEEIRTSLDRILAENRFNPVLNLLSGLTNLLLNKGNIIDIEMFNKAIEHITTQKNKQDIYIELLKIAQHMTEEMKLSLNESLTKYFNNIEDLLTNYRYLHTSDIANKIISLENYRIIDIERKIMNGIG